MVDGTQFLLGHVGELVDSHRVGDLALGELCIVFVNFLEIALKNHVTLSHFVDISIVLLEDLSVLVKVGGGGRGGQGQDCKELHKGHRRCDWVGQVLPRRRSKWKWADFDKQRVV